MCKNGNATGRWVKLGLEEKEFTKPRFDWSPRDSLTHFKDSQGRFWAPYNCKYLPISYTEFSQCMSRTKSSLHFYGDSNIRRPLKVMATGGSWCHTMMDPSSRECNCEDYGNRPAFYIDDGPDVNFVPIMSGQSNFSSYWLRVNGFSYDGYSDFPEKLESYQSDINKYEIQNPRAMIFNLGI